MNSFPGSFLLPQLGESEPEPILVCLSTGMVTNGSIPARLYAPKTLPACLPVRSRERHPEGNLAPGVRLVWPRRQVRSRWNPHHVQSQPIQHCKEGIVERVSCYSPSLLSEIAILLFAVMEQCCVSFLNTETERCSFLMFSNVVLFFFFFF